MGSDSPIGEVHQAHPTPTPGRIVNYHAHVDDPGGVTHPVQAALINAVHSDTCVSLHVFTPLGEDTYGRTSVVRQDAAGDEAGTWSWPKRT